MKFTKQILIFSMGILFLSSCVSKKKFTSLESDKTLLESTLENTEKDLAKCIEENGIVTTRMKSSGDEAKDLGNELSALKGKYGIVEKELEYVKKNNDNLLTQISNLSNLNKADSDNLKKTLESLAKQTEYAQSLNDDIRAKDSLSLALVTNLKRSLSDINDDDIQINVRKGLVYISISDKLLFKSGSAKVNSKAEVVLGKVAKVINDHAGLEVMIEGHTDNVPISTGAFKDNWDLSVMRSTAIIRVLQKKYNVAPERLTAAGRAEYAPKSGNDSSAGRASNRRTEIVITPKLNEYFELMQSK